MSFDKTSFAMGYQNASKRASSLIRKHAVETDNVDDKALLLKQADLLDAHFVVENNNIPAHFVPILKLVEQARIMQENMDLKSYCSAAATDYSNLVALLSSSDAINGQFSELFAKAVKECRETSEFLKLISEGKFDGVMYQDELSKLKTKYSTLENEHDNRGESLVHAHNVLHHHCDPNNETVMEAITLINRCFNVKN